MALFNYATKEITLKIVYYGPGLSGKTTNLQYLHSALNTSSKGKLLSLSTEADRTLFFDFLPVELGKIRDFSIRFQLYTVPGQVRYNATRRIVLKGADAIVFVADSQREMREQNVESAENMRENLLANNIDPDDIPVVLQYNKRDLKDIASVEELDHDLNGRTYPVVAATAIDGTGVEEAFKLISKLLLQHISRKHKIEIEPTEEKKEAPPPPPPPHKTESAPPEREASVVIPEPRQRFREAEPHAHRGETNPPRLAATAEPAALPKKTGYARGAGEASAVSREDIRKIVGEVEKIRGNLDSLKDSFSAMAKEMKALSEMKKTREETNSLLRDIKELFAGLKKGRRWFRF